MIMDLDDGLFAEGRIPWGEPPSFKNVLSDDGEAFLDEETEEEVTRSPKRRRVQFCNACLHEASMEAHGGGYAQIAHVCVERGDSQ